MVESSGQSSSSAGLGILEAFRRARREAVGVPDAPSPAGEAAVTGPGMPSAERAAVPPDAAPGTLAERGVPADAAPGTLLERRSVAPDVLVLRVARPPGFSFLPGQHLSVGKGGVSHSYTIASAPHEPWLELCIELVPGGRLSPVLFALREGDRVELGRRAKGSLLLDADADHHFMMATVTGIAPFVSMLRHVLRDRPTGQRFYVLHGASLARELAYADELARLAAEHGDALSYVPVVSRPEAPENAGWSGETGRLPAIASQHAERFGLAQGRPRVYACGHPAMVQAARDLFADLPVSTEAFFD